MMTVIYNYCIFIAQATGKSIHLWMAHKIKEKGWENDEDTNLVGIYKTFNDNL
jgi:hypothetical protein